MKLLDDNRFSKISFFVLFIIVILISYKIFAHFLLAIIVGAVFAQILKPVQNKLVHHNINQKISAGLILIIFIMIMIIPLFFFIQSALAEASRLTQLYQYTDLSFNSLTEYLIRLPIFNYFIKDQISLENQLRSWVSSLVVGISSFIIRFASEIPTFIIDTIFILLSIFVFLLNTERIVKFISNLVPLHEYLKYNLIVSSYEISKMAFIASLLAAAGQTITISLGFLILSVPNIILASGATFIFSFIPLIGSVPVWMAGVVYLMFYGSAFKIIVMIVIGLIASFIDNFIRAYVLKGSKEGLHPLIGLIAVIGGMRVFGFLGFIVGPIIIALLISMCKVWPSVLGKIEK